MAFPPSQEPPAPQLMITCGLKATVGKAPFLLMLILSASEDVGPWAQQEPQYTGMCWFLVKLR